MILKPHIPPDPAKRVKTRHAENRQPTLRTRRETRVNPALNLIYTRLWRDFFPKHPPISGFLQPER